MAYNTNNPVGSTDPRDLYDNAGNLDKFVNGDAPFYADRLGQQRKSWSGMEADFASAQEGREAEFNADQAQRYAQFEEFIEASGFYFLGDYGPGLAFTSRNQYTVRDGYAYRIANTVTLPYTSTGNWALESGNFTLFSQDDVLRQDLAAEDGARRVGYGPSDVFAALGEAVPVRLKALAEIATAGLQAGDYCSVNGTAFLVSATRPADVRSPLISAGTGLYAVPVKDALDLRLGSFIEQGSVTDAAKFASASNRIHQGAVIDNQNARIFLTAAVTPEGSPQTGYVYEYNYSDGAIGALVAASGQLTIGHGDFFAVTTSTSGDRTVWFYKPIAGTYDGGGSLCAAPWGAGITDASITLTVPLSGYFDTRRAEVQNFDAEHLSIRGVQTYICKISDLALGNFSPVQVLESNPTPQGLTAIQPQQQFAHMAGYWFGYSGAFRKRKLNGFLLAGSMEGDLHGAYIYDPAAPAEAELEGLCWRWNADLAKFETCLTDYRASTGQVIIYNQATGTTRQNERSFPLMQRKVTSNTAAQWVGGVSMVNESTNPISAPALLVGGYDNAANSTSNDFDPEDFRIEQFASAPGGRKGARLRFFKNGDLIFDGSDDSVFGAGVRFTLGGVNCMHVRPNGLYVGDTHQTAAQLGKVQVRGTTDMPCFYTTVANVGYYSNGTFDYTVEEGAIMQLGSWNSTTKVGTTWYNVSVSSFGPNTDNTKDLGTASNRWAVVRAGTGAISTSDRNTKQQIRPIDDAVLRAWANIEYVQYKFNDAVSEKGNDGARWHFGLVAQQIKEAFEAEGLNAFDYGILCFDEWEETPEALDEKGNVVQQYIPAGSRYGVRYDEANAVEAAYIRSKLASMS